MPSISVRGHRRGRVATSVALALAMAGGAVLSTGGPTAGAQSNPFQRGPNPTNASIEATRGAFAISQTSVPSLVERVRRRAPSTTRPVRPRAPSEPSPSRRAPSAAESAIAWLGPRIASQGFVVLTIATNSIYDQPGSRADQLQAALNYLVNSSNVRTRIDRTRLGLMGHSMGGGGTLEATEGNTSLQAAVPLQPWHTDKTFPGIRTPTMIIGAENDTIASVAAHSIPFYNSIPASAEKAYLEINNASHLVANSPNTTLAKYSIAWLKRYIDNDTRYEGSCARRRAARRSRSTGTPAPEAEPPPAGGRTAGNGPDGGRSGGRHRARPGPTAG